MKNKFSIIYIVPLVATLLLGCGPSGPSFRLEGSFEGMTGGELYIYNLSDEYGQFDTIKVAEGEFVYTGEANKETEPYMLVFPNAVEQVIFIGAGQDISYEVNGNDLRNYKVDGNDENELMNQFRKTTSSQSQTETTKTAETFIEKYSNSPVAIYLFDRYFVQQAGTNFEKTNSLLKVIKKAQPKNDYLLNIEGKLKTLQRSKVGKVISNVELQKKNKEKCKLWNEKQENTIILFWASWASSSYDTLWKIRTLRKDDQDTISGRIVCISLDTEYHRFELDSRNDSIYDIEHYCDGLAFESPTVKSIGVPVLPYYIITDKKHKVVAEGRDPDKMQADVRKYMK